MRAIRLGRMKMRPFLCLVATVALTLLAIGAAVGGWWLRPEARSTCNIAACDA